MMTIQLKFSNKRLRQITRLIHLITGISLILYIYSPLAESLVFTRYLQLVAIPIVSISGIVLWQQAKVSSLLRRS